MTCHGLWRALDRATAHAAMTVAPWLVLALTACATQPAPVQQTVELPAWIAQGKQFWGNETEGFFGVGTGEPAIENTLERELAAEVRARAAAMHEFEGWYVEWINSGKTTSVDPQILSALANQAEANVQIVKRWIGPDGRTFALAHLTLDFMKREMTNP
jgi:hypothetical protein